MKQKQSRNFACVVYQNNVDVLKERLLTINNISYFAFIVHDKDTLEDGSPKPPHTHVLLVLKSARDINCIKGYLEFYVDDKLQNVFAENMSDKKRAYEYLTHKNDTNKYQYSDSDIVTNDSTAFISTDRAIDNTADIIEDMLSGKPLREMVAIYGREFVYKYNCYRLLVEDIKMQELTMEHERERQDMIETDISTLPII